MKTLKLIYRILLVLLGTYGLYLNMSYGNTFELLHYFTILSNILVVGFFIFLLFNKKDYPKLKGAITMSITVTFLIFHFMLRPTMFDMINTSYSPYSISNLLVHYIVPIMTIFDWIFFDKKGSIK